MERADLNPNNERNLDRWVNDELAALGPDKEWQPDLHRGFLLLRERQGGMQGRRRRWTGVVAGAMVTCLALMATPVTRAFAQRCVTACVSEAGWVRQFLTAGARRPSISNAYIRPETRTTAPDFTLNDSSGKPVSLSQFRGDVVLLNFWATWCAPCRVEIPMFIGFQQAYRDRNFVVLGVSLDEDGWNAVRPFADEKKINYLLLVGDDRTADRFGGLKAVPTTLVIDRMGRVAAVYVGLCKKDECEADIKTVLNE